MSKFWLPFEEKALVHYIRVKKLSYAQAAEKLGRTERACKDKFYEVGPSIHDEEKPRKPEGDDTYVGMCLAQGGFCWLSERDLGQGNYAVCLPVNWPARRAA